MLCIKELDAPHLHSVFVEEVVITATEKKTDHRVLAGKLIAHMVKQNFLKLQELVKG